MRNTYCIGDSNTWGYDSRSYLGSRYPREVRWTGILEASGIPVINLGQNGACIRDFGSFEQSSPLFQNSSGEDIAVILLGSNDLLSGRSAENTAWELDQLISSFLPHFAHTVLCSPVPLQEGEWVTSASMIQESELLPAFCSAIAERYHILCADSDHWGIDLLYDGVHFSEKGHRIFAEHMKQLLLPFHSV